MKTTPKLKSRRMWVNRYIGNNCLFAHPSKVIAVQRSMGCAKIEAMPVAVIPLDDVPALQSTAFNAYCAAQDANRDSMECVVAALAAIGVLPRARKGRK